MLRDYYAQMYPHRLVQRLLAQWSPDGCEVLIKGTACPVIRNRPGSDAYELLRDFHPADGLHCAGGHGPGAALVLDLDHDTPRAMLCTCAELGTKRICNNCWVAMAGAARAYCYVLRRQFGCREILTSFSGGRGCHIVALRPDVLSHRMAVKWFDETLPNAITDLATAYTNLTRLFPRKAIPLTMLNPHTRVARLLQAPAEERDMLRACYTDPAIVELFKACVLPFFLDEWRPRVLTPATDPEDAVTCAGGMLAAPHRHATRCKDCVRVDAFAHAASAHQRQTARNVTVFALHDRIDVFLAVMSLFYVRPDSGLLSPTHMLRVPFSPHERSGNMALPLALHEMHLFRPEQDAVQPDGHHRPLFDKAVRLVEDTVDRLERRHV